jgi:hypothetical protein
MSRFSTKQIFGEYQYSKLKTMYGPQFFQLGVLSGKVKLFPETTCSANAGTTGTSAVLMVGAHEIASKDSEYHREYCEGFALVLLSDDRFALMCWDEQADDLSEPSYWRGAMYIEDTLPGLLELVSAASEEPCFWTTVRCTGGYDALTLSCFQRFVEEAQTSGQPICAAPNAPLKWCEREPGLLRLGGRGGLSWSNIDDHRVRQLGSVLRAFGDAVAPDSPVDVQRSAQLREATMEPNCVFKMPLGDSRVQAGSRPKVVDAQILHPEPPTRIGAHEAAVIVAVQEADLIQRQMLTLEPTASPLTTEAEDALMLSAVPMVQVQFKRCPKELPTALAEKPALRQCRQMLEAAGHNWKLPNGDMAFVHPQYYRNAMHALVTSESKSFFSIIFTTDLEYLIEEIIADVGKGATVKTRSSLQVSLNNADVESIGASAGASDVEDGPYWPIVESRTFIGIAPIHRNSASVVQSSTEAHRGGMNPRRVVPTGSTASQ